MWPVNLYSVGGASETTTAGEVAVGGILEVFTAADPLVRAGAGVLGTVVVAMIVLGLLQGYGPRSVAKARRSPVISGCIGLPGALVIGGLASTGLLIADTSLGIFFGIPLVAFGALVLPVLTTLGFVAIGTSIAARFGQDRLGPGVLVGGLVAGLASLSVVSAILLVGLAASLGVGAGFRVLIDARGTTRPDERTVPPANKI
ncbi:hypothetical protein [Natronobacterium texcoconense]|uniref:Uncharacterized protein n=1 Tax=Natronobacterium texcoconense TaxID=1095778 RepID=A0A1H1EW44_NATTX|nr:hypothetical protein [Natronobacterium texcoconense]SDQ92376.1 hypothetical protein SAMN04489842_1705 [Natronobacterium texcoconense]